MSDSQGFPQELDFHQLKSMYPSRKTEYRKNPINSQTFTTAGQDIQLMLSKMENTFYDPQTLCVNFRVTYNQDSTAVKGTDDSFLIGSAYSHFSKQVIKPASGVIIETIENPSLLTNAVTSITTCSMEKLALSTTWGFNSDAIFSNLGRRIIPSQVPTERVLVHDYSIPLIGILNTNKLLPAFVTDIEIDLTLNNVANFISNATTKAITGYSITNVELVCEAITLESSSMQLLMQMYPGVIKLKSESYLYGSSQLASGYSGTTDITYSHSLNSLKKFIWWSSPLNAWELNYAGVNPNASSWGLIIGSQNYPQQNVKSARVTEAFMQNSKAYGSMYSTSHSGSAKVEDFGRSSTAYELYQPYVQKPALAAYTSSSSNKWYQALDLEIINNENSVLFNGISTKGSTNTLRLNVGFPLATQPHAVHFFSNFDVILEFDYLNQTINVIQ